MAEGKKQAVMEIVIDDGSQRIPIKNEYGDEIGMFYFRPTDIGIIQRYNETMEKFDEVLAPLENVDITEEGTAKEGDSVAMEAISEAEKRLFEACDYIFGGNMSEAFFGKMHPFSPIGGVFYCETALSKVGSFISSQFEKETEKVNQRLNQYIGKYGKGKKK